MRTEWGTATDAGGRREVNEDAVLAAPPVFVVADGMGGHARGEMASRTVVDELGRLAGRDPRDVRPADVEEAVRRAGEQIQRTMAEATADRWTTAGKGAVAGTTVTGAVLTEQDGEAYWLVLNVGDSRVYRFVEGALTQVSVDHSLVQEMVDAGTITRADARTHPRRNVITRAVGTGPAAEVDFWMLRVHHDDRLLLCSDGLLGELDESEIAEVLAGESDPARAARELVERAVAGGANDNVTVLVVDAGDEREVETTARNGDSHRTPQPAGGPEDVA